MPSTVTLILGSAALVALVLFVLFLLWLRDPVFTPVQKVYYFIASLLVRYQWGATYEGTFSLPETGAAIVILNHRSSVDPFFIQTQTRRKIRWMVAREYVSHWALAWFLKPCEVIPVGRGGVDTAATKVAFREIASGGVVGMLPEGRINMTDEVLLPVRPGVALVALRAKVPVIPCFIHGAPYNKVAWSPFFRTARVKVVFGPPVDLSDFYDRESEPGVQHEAILRCAKALVALAGRPDFEPTVAGKQWKPE